MNHQTAYQTDTGRDSLEGRVIQNREKNNNNSDHDYQHELRNCQPHHGGSLCNNLQEQQQLIVSFLPNSSDTITNTISLSTSLAFTSTVQHKLALSKLSPEPSQIDIMQTEKKIYKQKPSLSHTNYNIWSEDQYFMISDFQQTQKKKRNYHNSSSSSITSNIVNYISQGGEPNHYVANSVNNNKGENNSGGRLGDRGEYYEHGDKNDCGNDSYGNGNHTAAVDDTINNNDYGNSNDYISSNQYDFNHDNPSTNNSNTSNNIINNNTSNDNFHNDDSSNNTSSSIFAFDNKQSPSSSLSSTLTIISNSPAVTTINTNTQKQQQSHQNHHSHAVVSDPNNKNPYRTDIQENILLNLTYSKYKALMTDPAAYQLIQLQNHHTKEDNFLLHYKSTTYSQQQSSKRQSIKQYLLQIADVMQQRVAINSIISEMMSEWVGMDDGEKEISKECGRLLLELDSYDKEMMENKTGDNNQQHIQQLQNAQHSSYDHQTQISINNKQDTLFEQQHQEGQMLLLLDDKQIDGQQKCIGDKQRQQQQLTSLNCIEKYQYKGQRQQVSQRLLEEEQIAYDRQLLALQQEHSLVKQQLYQLEQQYHQVKQQINTLSSQLSSSQLNVSKLLQKHSILSNSIKHHSSHFLKSQSILVKATQYVQYQKVHEDLLILSEQLFQLTFIVLQLMNRQVLGHGANQLLTSQSQSITRLCQQFTSTNQGRITNQFLQNNPLSRLSLESWMNELFVEKQEILQLLQQQQCKQSILSSLSQEKLNFNNNTNTTPQSISSQLIGTITKQLSQTHNHLLIFYNKLQTAIKNYFSSKLHQHYLTLYQSHPPQQPHLINIFLTELYQLIDGNSYHSHQIKQLLFSFNHQFLSFGKKTFCQYINYLLQNDENKSEKTILYCKILEQ